MISSLFPAGESRSARRDACVSKNPCGPVWGYSSQSSQSMPPLLRARAGPEPGPPPVMPVSPLSTLVTLPLRIWHYRFLRWSRCR